MPVYPELTEGMRIGPQAETALYEYFVKNLPDNYTAIYSSKWICNFRGMDHENLIDPLGGNILERGFPLGEVDYILITPKGLLILEVKGGRVFQEDGNWYSIDRHGARNHIKNPLAQARQNMFAVFKTLKGGRRFARRFINMGYAVILPHTSTWLGTIEYQDILVFQGTVNNNLLKKTDRLINYWRRLWIEAGYKPCQFSSADIRHIASVLAPTTRLRKPNLRSQIKKFQEQILTLTKNQFDLLTSLAGNRKAVITGGAGTGKTLLAMEKARQTALQGHKTLFTCPNRLLSQYVKEYLGDIDNLEVRNFHELCYSWGVRTGMLGLQDPDGAGWEQLEQEYYTYILPEVLIKAADSISDKFEAIIVDEAQDMKDIYWLPLESCLVKEDPILYIFCDPNQSIWHIDDELPFNEPSFHLRKNLRNSRKVFAAIKAVRGEDDYQLVEGATEGEFKIIAIKYGDELKELHEQLLALSVQGFPRKDITIVTGRSENNSILAGEAAIGNFQLTRDPHDPAHKVLFSSVRRFRGMESAVVIMIEVDYIVDLNKMREELGERLALADEMHILREIAKETLIIGMSRAQHSLYILADEPTRKRLNEMGL